MGRRGEARSLLADSLGQPGASAAGVGGRPQVGSLGWQQQNHAPRCSAGRNKQSTYPQEEEGLRTGGDSEARLGTVLRAG